MKRTVKQAIEKAISVLCEKRGWEQNAPAGFDISIPKTEKFGEFSTNVAMIMASSHKTSPGTLAGELAEFLATDGLFSSVNVAGPGFINMTIKPGRWVNALQDILSADENFGRSQMGKSEKIMVEFVSANPTGPLHIGHGRGAVVGDVIARILDWAGYDVRKEYYINNVGLQMDNLGKSTIARARQILGRPFDAPAYKGEYIIQIAKQFLESRGGAIPDEDTDDLLESARQFTAEIILNEIRADLETFRVRFDNWFSEADLHDSGAVGDTLNSLLADDRIYERDGALWLKTEDMGDEKDRVVRRANGFTTYLAADIAYHKNKFDRGFSKLVDVWGADHHGYIPRMKAAVKTLGHDPENLVVRLVQLVSIKKGAEAIAMSTREGVFTTLKQIMDEVGVDAVRFFFLQRSSDSQLEFDVDLARKQSSENPVYYVQYAHARCSNIFVTASERGIEPEPLENINVSLLERPDEIRLIRKLLEFPGVVESCALSFHPHPVTLYLTETAGLFHYFYKHNRVVSDDPALTGARLALARATQITLRNGLNLIGVTAPKRM